MNVGILGASTVGKTLAVRLAKGGHIVTIANSRGPQSLSESLAGLDVPLTAASKAEVLASAEIVFLAIPWIKVRDVLAPGIAWNGRILVDTTNIFANYAPGFRVDDLHGESGSEIVARLAPSARVVKAFNTVPFAVMFAPHPPGLKRVLFVAGDDRNAASTVAGLITELGLHPVLLGSLASAGRQMELGGIFSGLELLTPPKAAMVSQSD
jgi:8-hydroxy-5-deazaflavin:NADPH oxidoreductase